METIWSSGSWWMLGPISARLSLRISGLFIWPSHLHLGWHDARSKHMVSLRGSKFGSRVAMLCCNPSHITRPGPGAGVQVNRFGNPTDERFPLSQPGSRFNRGGQWASNYPPFRWPSSRLEGLSLRLGSDRKYRFLMIASGPRMSRIICWDAH